MSMVCLLIANSLATDICTINRITSDNIEILKEQVATLERKLNNHENLQEEVAQLQVENEVFSFWSRTQHDFLLFS